MDQDIKELIRLEKIRSHNDALQQVLGIVQKASLIAIEDNVGNALDALIYVADNVAALVKEADRDSCDGGE